MTPIQEHTRTIKNYTVHYWETGGTHQENLVLLHGGIGDAWANWASVMPLLAENFHVFAPDLPGFGGSSPLSARRVDDLLHWLAALIDNAGLEQTVVVGNSYGGLVARLFAAAYPRRVRAVVLANGGIAPDFPAVGRIVFYVPILSQLLLSIMGRMATSERMLNRLIYVKAAQTPTLIISSRDNAKGFSELMRLAAMNPLPSERTPHTSTLILWGLRDTLANIETARGLQAQIPNAILIEIPDCGHMPQVEMPEIFNRHIQQFVYLPHPIIGANS